MPWLICFLSTLLFLCAASDNCPCEKPELCRQIQTETEYEVFVFDVGGKTWKSYNWSIVTTVAAFGKYDPELMCHAHSVGARLVLKGDVRLADIVDQNNRTAWIKEKVDLAKSQFMDGINLDIEHAVEEGSPEYTALTELVERPLSFPHSDPRLSGYDQFLNMKIDYKKIVMGIPWYGYDYPCLNLTQEGICFIEKVPFRGAPCSDAAGKQKPYSWIMKQVNSSLTGRLWDNQQKAPYFNYEDDKGQTHQVWYDDPQSLCPKANAVMSKGLRGIGMWNGNILTTAVIRLLSSRLLKCGMSFRMLALVLYKLC
ncbi:hypothetical protein WMY93_025009 [Mugilogobius chulae]|uniref:GH18 domain-containing protein n=1 Tax=Mugilogobius chulae TaxID=88201 RepID=A0AAW0N5L3_9GOBI